MQRSLIHWIITTGLFLVFTPLSIGAQQAWGCLPEGIKPNLVISSHTEKSNGRVITETVTVSQSLTKLRARCKHGKLVDGKGREIRFHWLIGCWGYPPPDYQEILQEQRRELERLKKKYTVIEISCSRSTDRRMISMATAFRTRHQ